MKELLPQILNWKKTGKSFAIARVIQTWGSSPRPVGSSLVITEDGEMAGSVSGGCVEGAVIKESKNVIAQKIGKRLAYGVSDDEAWAVGLTCGGKVQVYLQSFPSGDTEETAAWKSLLDAMEHNRGGVLVTTLTEGATKSSFLSADGQWTGPTIPDEIVAKAQEALDKRVHQSVMIGEVSYFIHVFPRRSQLLIIGAAHITADLVQLAHLHDFETIVIDPRGAFADNTAFSQAPDHIFVKYPSEVLPDYSLDSYTYAVVLSHDPKIDDNALQILLKSKAAYIGALGSRKTHEKRVARLAEAGFTESEINRIESPIGVDINALGAKEIALSIMASVIRTKNEFL